MLMPNSMVVQFMGELLNDYYDQAGWTDGCIMYLVNSIFAERCACETLGLWWSLVSFYSVGIKPQFGVIEIG